MPWAVAATVVVGAYTADQQKDAAEGAAAAGERGAQLATAEQRRQYDLTRQDQAPWMQAGQSALGRLDAASTGDFSAFTESPGYQFRVDQGAQMLNRGAAANGSFNSGGADADRIALGQGLASAEFGDWWNRQAGIAGVGQSTASGLGSLGANMAGQIGNNHMNAANARASSFQQSADANSQFAAGVGGAFNNWYQGRQQPQTQQQPFAYQPQQSGWQSGTGTLGPSNGSSWNFGDN